MTSSYRERIIALDLRPKSLGFAVFEGEKRLLDWGAKSFPGGVNTVRVPLGPKIRQMLAAYVPDALVLEEPRTGTDRMLRELKKAARARHVAIRFLPSRAVRSVFPECRNKHQIASALSERFPELLWVLPEKRKIWMKEDYWAKVFDAAAKGIAYFARKQRATVPLPPS
jgi:hypothetical protein